MTERVRSARWPFVMVCCLLPLGACGDGSSAVPTQVQTSTSPAPTSEPTDRAGEPIDLPQRSPAMDQEDEAGAEAAAEYFMELSGYAVRSQDLSEFEALCDAESIYCKAVIDEVRADVSAGNYTVGGDTSFSVDSVDPPGENPFYVVWGTLDRTPFVAYDAGGHVIYQSDGDNSLEFAVAAQYDADGRWIFRGAQAGAEDAP